MENKIKLFAKWLKNFKEDNFNSMTEGTIERLLRQQKDETMNHIGDMLLEILDFDDQTVLNELKSEK